MAQTALTVSGNATGRRRAFFGLFNADGWPWAIVKALFWFVLIILLLGYIPDRAYYFTVQKTVDVGLLAWSPVNLCPPTNEGLPCPVPGGATLPWHQSPAELSLPAARTDGVAGVIGTTYLYAGGSDGSTAVADTYVSHAVPVGNIDRWATGPTMPEPRRDAASIVVGNTMYVLGGYDSTGQPTSKVYSLTVANDGSLGEWKTEDALVLPAPRAGLSVVAVSDGLVIMGGTDGTAASTSVWKTKNDTKGKPGPWTAQNPLVEANVDGVAAHVGDVIFLIGGTNDKGQAVATVQLGHVGGPHATTADPSQIADPWAISAQTNLPGPRTNMSGFTANGVLYVQGGTDGVAPRGETLWTTPDANGIIPGWQHLAQDDLGQGISGSAAITAGSNGFILGGTTASGPVAGAARTDLAPQPPFFQAGILGATIPALKVDGEIGQQLGYLAAAGAGTVNFILLILVGYAYAHRDKVSAFIARRRRRRG